MKMNNYIKKQLCCIGLLVSPLSFADTFVNDNQQYVIEPNLYASQAERSAPVSPTPMLIFKTIGLDGQPSVQSKQANTQAFDSAGNEVIETKGNFNIIKNAHAIIKNAHVNQAQTQQQSTTNSNVERYAVVKNKRFGNYGIVLDSLVAKVAKKDASNIQQMFAAYASDLQIASHTSSGLVFFKPTHYSLDNLLALKSKLEQVKGVEWVNLEIFEHEKVLN